MTHLNGHGKNDEQDLSPQNAQNHLRQLQQNGTDSHISDSSFLSVTSVIPGKTQTVRKPVPTEAVVCSC